MRPFFCDLNPADGLDRRLPATAGARPGTQASSRTRVPLPTAGLPARRPGDGFLFRHVLNLNPVTLSIIAGRAGVASRQQPVTEGWDMGHSIWATFEVMFRLDGEAVRLSALGVPRYDPFWTPGRRPIGGRVPVPLHATPEHEV